MVSNPGADLFDFPSVSSLVEVAVRRSKMVSIVCPVKRARHAPVLGRYQRVVRSYVQSIQCGGRRLLQRPRLLQYYSMRGFRVASGDAALYYVRRFLAQFLCRPLRCAGRFRFLGFDVSHCAPFGCVPFGSMSTS